MTDGSSALWLCNAGASSIFIWLEPWAEEFELSSRSELLIRIEGDPEEDSPDIEQTEAGFAIYAVGGTRLRLLIDGAEQRSSSSKIEAPGTGPLSTRGLVDLLFGDLPEGRAGGQPRD